MRLVIVTVCLTAWLSGCADNGDRYPGAIRTEATTPAWVGKASLYERRADVGALIKQFYPDGPSGLDAQVANVDMDTSHSGTQMAVRNSVAGAVIDASARNCDVYLESLRGDQVANRTFSDLLAAGFGIAGGLASPVQSAKILSSLAGFSTAAGASIDRNVFAQQAVELIADQIKKYRATERAAIEAKYSKSYSDWSLSAAMADVAEYHADCSMMKGLVLTQDFLTKREALVQAARAAAQKAADSSASGQTVAAVVDAITQADTDQTTTPLPASSSTALATTDLDGQQTAFVACLTDAQTAMTNSASVTVETLLKQDEFAPPATPASGGKCSDKSDWSTQFNKFLEPAFANAGLDKIQQVTDDKARRAQMATAFAAIQTSTTKKVADQIGQIAATRNSAINYIDGLGKSGASADDVKAALNLLAQPSIVKGDPVFAAMIAGASVTASGASDALLTSGQLASALAEAQARSFESSAGSAPS